MAFWKGRRSQRGSAATEYMLAISVIVVGVTAAGYTFVPQFRTGTDALATDVSSILASGDIGGVGTSRDGGPTAAGTDGANGSDATGTTGSGGSAPTGLPPSGSNCTGGIISNCSAQTAGVGGADGHVDPTTSGASTVAVQTLTDPSATTSEKQAAAEEVATSATANCSQVLLASVTGESVKDVTVDTVKNGLTVPDTMQINLPFWGFSFGKIPTDYKGYMTLDQMQTYLSSKGIQSDVKNGASVADLQTALANHQRVGVIIDVDQDGNPTSACGGKCGHTVKVVGVSNGMVQIRDKNGMHQIPADQFNAAWQSQNSGMIAITPKSQKSGWASNWGGHHGHH